MHEIWKPVSGFEGYYSVSNLGRVRSEARFVENNGGAQFVRERILKASPSKQSGYPVVNLTRNGSGRPYQVHTLVAEVFLGSRPEGTECAHNDGSKTNAAVSNLRWATPASNNKDKVQHGTQTRGESHQSAKLTLKQVYAIKEDCRSQAAIAKAYGISPATVSRLKNSKSWTHL